VSNGHDAAVPISAPSERVWALLADISRMGEWSPECVRCRWLPPSSAAEPGARFKGTSRNGRHRWSTTSTIVEAVPGRRLTFDVTYFRRPVARWSYEFESPEPNCTKLTESVEDRRGPVLRLVSPFVTGSRDRAERNAATMATTLERLKAAAEQ
jgi:uncharacterized protein YndB with AHSA1/START domain